jgi:hypothetical protein
MPAAAIGGTVAHRLGFRRLVELVPVGGGIGMAAYLLTVNLLAYAIPVQVSFFAAGWLLLLAALGLLAHDWRFGAGGQPRPRAPLRATAIVGGVTLVIGLFFGIIIIGTRGYDAWAHWSFIASIAHGNFPVRLPSNPDFYIQYHYGFDLVAAAFQRAGGISPWMASAVVTTFAVTLSAALASALGYVAFKSLRLAVLLPVLLFFAGGLVYLDVFRGLESSSGVLGYVEEMGNRFSSQEPFSTGLFHANMTETFGVFLHHRPSAFAMPFFLLFLLLAYVQHENPRPAVAILMGLVLAALALSLETTFAIILAAFVMYRGATYAGRWRRQGFAAIRREATYDGFTVALAGTLAVFQGGVITDALLHRGGETSGAVSSVSLRENPGFVSFSGFVPIGEDGWLWTVLKEFGLPLILFPAYVLVAVKRPHPVTTLLLITAVLSFATPLIVEYPSSEVELVRFFALSGVANGLLMAITLHHAIETARQWSPPRGHTALAAAAALVAMTAFSPLMFSVIAMPSKPSVYSVDLTTDEYTVAQMAQTIVPSQSRVLAAWPDEVTMLWGSFTPYAESRATLFIKTTDWNRALERPDLPVLRQLGIGYVYYSPRWIKETGVERAELDALPYLKRLYDYVDESDGEYGIYRVAYPETAVADTSATPE